MERKHRIWTGCTLALAGVLGAAWYTAAPAQAASPTAQVALSGLKPSASSCQVLRQDTDAQGQKLALPTAEGIRPCQTGLLTVPGNKSYASVSFVDVQENGYERFQADVGLQAVPGSKGGEVEFRVLADGKQVFASGAVTSDTPAKHVEVDLRQVQVLQLVVDARGSNAHDLAVWGDACFTKTADAPYLAVDDLEFNQSWQVTKQNILEYVVARDAQGQDISQKVTYQTDYKGEDKGTFHVTYTAADQAGHTHTRTVNLTVTGEDYTRELSMDRLKKPWASYLYHGRGTLDSQGKKAWDLILAQVLDFHPEQWKLVKHWGEEVYAVDVDLQAHHIYATPGQLSALESMLMDDEPRTFHVKDWGCQVTQKDGLASHVTVWVSKQGLRQEEWLKKIEANAQKMLAKYQPDMTEAQALSAVSNAYKGWLRYGGLGQLLTDSLGNGTAVCGGNARGYIYLSQRLGTKSVWGRSNSHAWSFTKLADVAAWYKTDLLSGEFLAPGKHGEGNLSVGGNFKSRHYRWFEFGQEQYDRTLLRYPSVWVEVSRTQVVLPAHIEYRLEDYISSFGSIFRKDLPRESVKIAVDKVNAQGEVVQANVPGFSQAGSSDALTPGSYRVTYTVTDGDKHNTASLNLRVTGQGADRKLFGDKSGSTGYSMGAEKRLGLWNGTGETWYQDGIFINNGGTISYDVKGQGYRYVSFDFGIKKSVRDNVQWGRNGQVAVQVEVTTPQGVKVLHQGNTLGWKTHYEGVLVQLPADAQTVTIRVLDKGHGNGHAGIGGLTFYRDAGEAGA